MINEKYRNNERQESLLIYLENYKDLTNVVIVFDIIVLLILGLETKSLSEVSNGLYLATLFFCAAVFLCEFLSSLFGAYSAEKDMQKDFILRDEFNRFCRLSIKIRNTAFIAVFILFTLLLVGAVK